MLGHLKSNVLMGVLLVSIKLYWVVNDQVQLRNLGIELGKNKAYYSWVKP